MQPERIDAAETAIDAALAVLVESSFETLREGIADLEAWCGALQSKLTTTEERAIRPQMVGEYLDMTGRLYGLRRALIVRVN